MTFWDIIWFIVVSFAFVAYLILLFMVLGDLFRDRDTSGGVKALWVIALVVFPYLTALLYLVVRGGGMAERSEKQSAAAQRQAETYVRGVAGTSGATPAEQIVQAQKMLSVGAISQPEYDRLKEKALA
jgi:hypothetical protein